MPVFLPRPASGRTSFEARTLLFIGFVCALLLGLEGLRCWGARIDELEETRSETANLAHAISQHVHHTVDEADLIVRALRDLNEAESSPQDSIMQLHRILKAESKVPVLVNSLAIIGADGAVVTGAGLPGRLDYANLSCFRFHAMNPDREALITVPPLTGDVGGPLVIVTRRIDRPDGSFGGLVAATLSLEALQTYFNTFDASFDGTITLMNSQGIVVARSPVQAGMVGRDASTGMIFSKFLPQAPAGSVDFVSTLDRQRRIGSYRHISGYPLVIVVSRTLDSALSTWRSQSIHRMILTGLAAMGVGVLGLRLTCRGHQLFEAEAQYRLLAENSSDGIVCIDSAGRCLYASPAFIAMTGRTATDTLVNQSWARFVQAEDRADFGATLAAAWHGQDHVSCVFRLLQADGGGLWTEAKFQLAPDGSTPRLVVNLRDVSRRKALEQQLEDANRELRLLASQDALTGLANRRQLEEMLRLEWRRAARERLPLSLILLDVDHFKAFNDRYGHLAGDDCLIRVAALLKAAARRPGDLAARYGGEEMLLVLPGTDAPGAEDIAEHIRMALEAAEILHEGNEAHGGIVTASFGVATTFPRAIPDPAIGISALIMAADQALYRAKEDRNRVVAAAALHAVAI